VPLEDKAVRGHGHLLITRGEHIRAHLGSQMFQNGNGFALGIEDLSVLARKHAATSQRDAFVFGSNCGKLQVAPQPALDHQAGKIELVEALHDADDRTAALVVDIRLLP